MQYDLRESVYHYIRIYSVTNNFYGIKHIVNRKLCDYCKVCLCASFSESRIADICLA